MISIAIDGPAGAGKSTIAKSVAESLGFIHVDTGALYRAIAFYLIKNNISKNAEDINKALKNINIKISFENKCQVVILNGNDITDLIRTPDVTTLASEVSKLKDVRKFLLSIQQNIISENNVVMDGRDIGTVILPKANVKIFLTASPECRAKRRYLQLQNSGINCNYDEILKDVNLRDIADTTREIAPLKKAPDAILVDTSSLSLDESIQEIIEIINNKLHS